MTTQTANWQIRGAAMELIAAKFAMDGGKHLVKTTWDIYTRLTAVKHPNCNVLGELVSLDFLELLNSSDMSLTVACRYFTMIHDLFHHSAQRYSDMRRFDQLAVVPFVRWLRDHYPVLTFSNIPNFHSNLNIGYLCTWGILLPGNPVASIQNLLISKHGTLSKRTIFTYLTSFANSEFVAGLSNTTVRDIRQGYTFESLDSAVKQILADKIDVLISDSPCATSTFIFSCRAAPIQIYLDLGTPFWSINELDWAITPTAKMAHAGSLPTTRRSYARTAYPQAVRSQPVNDSEILAARERFPKNCVLFGVFSRITKLSLEYISLVRLYLECIPNSHLLIVGLGESTSLNSLLKDSFFQSKITVINGMVDIAVYGKVIDIFCDTFPLSAGVAALEVANTGTPIVSMDTPDIDRPMMLQRDLNLVAKSPEQYIEILKRLISDPEFYQESSNNSKYIIDFWTNTQGSIDDIEFGIECAINYKSNKVASTNNR